MSKDQLEQILKRSVNHRITYQDYASILNCMVATYNRAIEDAVDQLMDHDGEIASWQIPDELNKLKI